MGEEARGAAAALGVAALAACTARRDADPRPTAARSGSTDPDVALLREWVAVEDHLVARYDAALAAVPALAEPLRTLRDHHVAHADALRSALGELGASPAPSADPAAPEPSPGPTASRRPAAVLRELAVAGRDAARAYRQGAARLRSADRALLAAELAAGESQQATLLGLLPVPAARRG